MKRQKLIYLIPLVVTFVTLFSCCKPTPIKRITIEKTPLKESVQEYIKYNAYNLSCSPTIGSTSLLVIPVWFTDSSNYIKNPTNVRDDISEGIFGNNTGWESLKSYYEKESFDQLTVTGKVSEWYECGHPASYYGISYSLTIDLVSYATNWYFTNNPNDKRKNYDNNGDGYLDGVILVYGAPDNNQSEFYSYDNLWAYTGWIQSVPYKSNPTPNVFIWCSYDFMYGSNVAYSRAGTGYSGGDTKYCSIDTHTFIHESGHMLGLQDYYDYDGRCAVAGKFSMQDHNIGGHDPYSLMCYGWANPYIPTTDGIMTIKSFQSSHDVILLTPEWNKYDTPFDEYVLVELYTPDELNEFDSTHKYRDAYDTGPSVPGIRVWHVDSRLVNLSTGRLINKASSGMCYLACNNNSKSDKLLAFKNYTLLQLIRNDTDDKKFTNTEFNNHTIFGEGSCFSIEKFDKQFNENGKLDNNKSLGWSFTVDKIYIDENNDWNADISLKK